MRACPSGFATVPRRASWHFPLVLILQLVLPERRVDWRGHSQRPARLRRHRQPVEGLVPRRRFRRPRQRAQGQAVRLTFAHHAADTSARPLLTSPASGVWGSTRSRRLLATSPAPPTSTSSLSRPTTFRPTLAPRSRPSTTSTARRRAPSSSRPARPAACPASRRSSRLPPPLVLSSRAFVPALVLALTLLQQPPRCPVVQLPQRRLLVGLRPARRRLRLWVRPLAYVPSLTSPATSRASSARSERSRWSSWPIETNTSE